VDVGVIGGPVAAEAAKLEFAARVGPHLAAMARLAARVAPATDRDDIVQEALLRAWRRWPTYDAERGALLSWLLAIVADQGRRARSRSRWVRLEGVSVAVTDPAAPAVLGDHDLERALRRLSGRQLLAIDLYYFVGLMGCAPGTVKATLHQARARLRDLVGSTHE
jgi:RNA polymerase sigma-70 factor (ECF subfamily)